MEVAVSPMNEENLAASAGRITLGNDVRSAIVRTTASTEALAQDLHKVGAVSHLQLDIVCIMNISMPSFYSCFILCLSFLLW